MDNLRYFSFPEHLFYFLPLPTSPVPIPPKYYRRHFATTKQATLSAVPHTSDRGKERPPSKAEVPMICGSWLCASAAEEFLSVSVPTVS
jgi:hypothetical protein